MNLKPQDKKQSGVKLYTAGILPFILGGLNDSFNPCSITILILFITLLVYVCRRPNLMFWSGFLYVLISGVFIYFIAIGKFENVRDSTLFYWVSRVYFIGLGVVFVVLGFKVFRFWFKNRKMVPPPVTAVSSTDPITPMNVWDSDKKEGPNSFLIVFILIVFGAGNTFLSSICPTQLYVSVNLYAMIIQKQTTAAFISLGFYSFAFILPLLFVLALFYF